MSLPPGLPFLAARMRASRGISSSVERQLPKLERRVRFPYPALDPRRLPHVAQRRGRVDQADAAAVGLAGMAGAQQDGEAERVGLLDAREVDDQVMGRGEDA